MNALSSTFFEELGLYIGPVVGPTIFEKVKATEGPVLIHIGKKKKRETQKNLAMLAANIEDKMSESHKKENGMEKMSIDQSEAQNSQGS
ncbi:hypothetical protein Fmac_024795 [Flemingia macrophylla]|uniref:Uncharacterized protein n=1 Tax=Flemingia macrophylla TaxID=520843 RepID=A0ABD1LQD2_9FABA